MYDTPSTYSRNSTLKSTPMKSGQDTATATKSSRLIPLWVQFVFFLAVAVFLYIVFSSMETNESLKGLEWLFWDSHSVYRVLRYTLCILIGGMYFGWCLYFRHCWNCGWCNICVHMMAVFFFCLLMLRGEIYKIINSHQASLQHH